MPLPSLNIRVRELHSQLDQLLGWEAHLPSGKTWVQRLNELRFVRATLAWEEYVEETFVCYLRGSQSILGRTYALTVRPALNTVNAQSLAIGRRSPYGKWLNESWTLSRASTLFSGPHPYAPLASPTFPEIRAIRNRIVHRSETARREFQRIVFSLYGSAKPGMTPGRLLSEAISGVPRVERYILLLKTAGTLIAS